MGKILRFALGLASGPCEDYFHQDSYLLADCIRQVLFIAVVCATDDLAQNLIADISEALGSPNMEEIYGKWNMQLSTDNKEEKKALYHGRAVIIKAKGAGSALRGLNIKHQRPDLIFFDDAQTKECDESEAERKKFKKWLVATFKIITPDRETG
jgi:hypothetical protein